MCIISFYHDLPIYSSKDQPVDRAMFSQRAAAVKRYLIRNESIIVDGRSNDIIIGKITRAEFMYVAVQCTSDVHMPRNDGYTCKNATDETR